MACCGKGSRGNVARPNTRAQEQSSSQRSPMAFSVGTQIAVDANKMAKDLARKPAQAAQRVRTKV